MVFLLHTSITMSPRISQQKPALTQTKNALLPKIPLPPHPNPLPRPSKHLHRPPQTPRGCFIAVTHGRGKFTLYEKNVLSTPHPTLGDSDVIVDLTYGSLSRSPTALNGQGWACDDGEELVELADYYLFEELANVQDKIMNGDCRPLTSPAVMFNDYRGMKACYSFILENMTDWPCRWLAGE